MMSVGQAGCFSRIAIVLIAVLTIGGCADVAGKATPPPVVKIRDAGKGDRFVISKDQQVAVSSFYSRVLSAGTIWEYRGTITDGDVYRPVNTVFTVESGNVHEAYLVLNGHQLVGYYLPVEQTFSQSEKPVSLAFNVVSSDKQ